MAGIAGRHQATLIGGLRSAGGVQSLGAAVAIVKVALWIDRKNWALPVRGFTAAL